MAKINLANAEKEPNFIGFRKDTQINTEMTRRAKKETKGRESLQERSYRNRTTTQRRHEINKARKECLKNLMKETQEEQEIALREEFDRSL